MDMGKRIISQARGKGGPRYRAPSHRYVGAPEYPGVESAVVTDILHDPGRDAPLARLKSGNREFFAVAVEGLAVGAEISFSGEAVPGNVLPLSKIPEGVPVCCVESRPGSGPKFCRSAGSFATIVSKEGKIILKMPSGKFKEFHPDCLATVGIPAGGGRDEKPFAKAGQKYYAMKARNKLWPRTSAVKMNAVDHPFGGSTKPGKPKTVSRDMPPGKKVGSIAARRTGKKKR